MYIEPNSEVYLLENIPLDPTYEHTILFKSANAQRDWFKKWAIVHLTNQSYVRADAGKLRINRSADKLYTCNYIMFQNTSYGNKWFYAFVTGVSYISNEVCEISWTIDSLQTWHFEYELQTCFIERQHTPTDNYGEHIIDEGLEIGDPVNSGYVISPGWDDYSVCVVTAFDPNSVESGDFSVSKGGFYSYIYSGFNIAVFPADGGGPADPSTPSVETKLDAFLRKINENNRTSSVLAVFMCPSFMVQQKYQTIIGNSFSKPTSRNIDIALPYGNAFGYANKDGSYYPKNKKLYTYPYCSLMVTNGDGDSKIYRWENFYSTDGKNVTFNEAFIFGASPVATTMPTVYSQDGFYRFLSLRDPDVNKYRLITNPDEALIMNDFVTCAYAVDSYRAWLAQKKAVLPYEIASQYVSNTPLRFGANQAMMGMAGSSTPPFTGRNLGGGDPLGLVTGTALTPYSAGAAAAPVSGGATAGAIAKAGLAAGGASLLVNTAGFVLNQMAQFAAAKLLPEGINGTIAGNGYSTAMRTKRFTYIQRQIKAEYAEIIDKYFTMFGYKINKVGIPSRNARPHWTFVKTTNCQIKGKLPADDAKFICDIYNHGITWWNNGDEVGNYYLDNTV